MWKSQTENAEKKKGGVRNCEHMQREARLACHTENRYQAMWQCIDKKYGLF